MTVHFGRFVGYYRVSTAEQGRSVLGLDAQKAAVEQRLSGGPWQLVGEFTEIESGNEAPATWRRSEGLQEVQGQARCRQARPPLAQHPLSVDANREQRRSVFADLPDVTGVMGTGYSMPAAWPSSWTSARCRRAAAHGIRGS
jgi:hypothetical protein